MLELPIGRLGCFNLAAGYYLYVGSAFGAGGLAARLARHRQPHKRRPHWHIDYLRAVSRLYAIWSVVDPTRYECLWCRRLAAAPGLSMPMPGFGASDTGCPAHLFYLPTPPDPGLLGMLIGIDGASASEL